MRRPGASLTAARTVVTGAPGPGARAPRHGGRLRRIRTARSRWPAAVLEVALAVILALLLPRLEHHHHVPWPIEYDAGTAQATLGAIAGGMITLTGFVLTAVTIIVQTMQAQSPRLLRLLDRSDWTPVLFGTFIATFTFALVVLSQVSDRSVPSVSVTVAVLLVLVSSGLFLRLLVTFRTRLTTGGLVRMVGGELRRLVDITYQAPYQPGQDDDAASPPGSSADSCWRLLHDGPPGVFQAFDQPAVVQLAAAAGTEIRLVPAVGDFIATGAPLATGTGPPPDAAALAGLVRVGPVRVLEQDPAYGIRVLVDIAIRALSPAVNDPTSAVQALDQIDDILHRLVTRSLGEGRLHDAAGTVRVRFPAPRWDSFVALALDEILRYGAGSLQVARRLSALLTDLLAAAPPGRAAAVAARRSLLRRLSARALPDPELAAAAAEPDRQGIGSFRRDG